MTRAPAVAGVAALAATLLTACSLQEGKTTTVVVTKTVEQVSDVPPPPIGKVLPRSYRARGLWRANLTGGPVPEAVVFARGPVQAEWHFHPATLMVLSWDPLAKRWSVIFDAQKVIAPSGYGSPQTSNTGPGVFIGDVDETPILDPEADGTVDQVRFASLLPGERKQLIFSATLHYGGSGVPSTLVVVDFEEAEANVVYAWKGEHLEWRLEGNRIVATSSYWTRFDAHCCPLRKYDFVVGFRERDGTVTTVSDERPYLGVLVRHTDGMDGADTPEVIEVAEDSPASSALRVGDVLLDVENAPPPPDSPAAGTVDNKLSGLNAGATARLVIRRDGARMTIPVRLGSLADATGLVLPEDDYPVGAL